MLNVQARYLGNISHQSVLYVYGSVLVVCYLLIREKRVTLHLSTELWMESVMSCEPIVLIYLRSAETDRCLFCPQPHITIFLSEASTFTADEMSLVHC